MKRKTAMTLGVGLFSMMCSAYSQTPEFIAGLRPYERPAQAPKLTEAPKTSLELAAHGIENLVKEQFTWWADQGAWFTPFKVPGMTGPYDIRSLHQGSKASTR